MKKLTYVVNLLFLSLLSNNVYADVNGDKRKVAHLLQGEKHMVWNTDHIIKADVAWGDEVDYIVHGKTDTAFVLAIVNGANTKKYHLMKFNNTDSFCDPNNVHVSTYPNRGHTLYKSTRKKLSIVLDDYTCDTNVIAWNKKMKTFELYRN